MELEGKAANNANYATIFSKIQSKTLDPSPDPQLESDPVSASPPSPPSIPVVANPRWMTRGDPTPTMYRECQKNHAAATGGHVIDGCCEFMAGGADGTPDALRCAACGCHRSFHRKEMDGQDSPPYLYAHTASKHLITAPALYCGGSYRLLQPPHGGHRTGEIGRRSSSSELDMKRSGRKNKKKKKRFRTKINEEQKERMREMAERLGWRMQKKDEEEVDRFCTEVNLRRQVFKVWMHNNKQAIKRKLASPTSVI